jgi:hypothetical protein
MSNNNPNLSASFSRAIIRSLTRGTTLPDSARHLNIGHDNWIAAQLELLDELAEDGYSDTKFVRGAYGSGKSHFLAVIQSLARQHGWATAHLECKKDGVEIDRFETVYPKIAEKLMIPSSGDDQPVDQIRALVDSYADYIEDKCRLRTNGVSRPFDADERLYNILQPELMQTDLPVSFVKAVASYVRARYAGDLDSVTTIISWLKGGDEKFLVPRIYLERPEIGGAINRAGSYDLKPLGKGTAPDALKGILWLLRHAGHAGLVLCVDEVEV